MGNEPKETIYLAPVWIEIQALEQGYKKWQESYLSLPCKAIFLAINNGE